jgi:succinoglycan biosynthesis transport protein ExoP
MSGARTLVVDADLYRSTLTKRFAPNAQTGLIEALQEPDIETVKQYIVREVGQAFDFLPAIPRPTVNPTELFGSHKMQALLQSLYQLYDIIIFDLPPSNPVLDSVVLGSHLDGIVILVEWGSTPIDAIAELTHALGVTNASIIGIAITKVSPNGMSHYGRYDSVYDG